MKNNIKTHWGKYFSAFFITSVIFATAIVTNNYFNTKRITQLRSIQEDISIDILSLETQFDLLREQSCKSINQNPILSRELDNLARKLSFTEARLGADNEEVLRLKKQYSLLEIKDLLLMKKISEKCDDIKPVFLLYFYSNKKGECPDCKRQGYVLTELAKQYPQIRIYSFDYNLDVSAIETLISLKNIPNKLPAIVIGNEPHSDFKSIKEIVDLLPELSKLTDTISTSTEEIK